MSDVALSIVLGIGLAAATGFRVFLPMLIVSGAAYAGYLPLGDNFAWLGTAPSLVMLTVAAIVEILAYYIPGLDNLLDALATPAAFVAGTVLSAAVDRYPTHGEMDGRRHRRRRHCWCHARRDGNAEGKFYRLDWWSWQLHHRNCRARRRIVGRFSGPGCARRRNRADRSIFMARDKSSPLAVARSASIDRRERDDLNHLIYNAVRRMGLVPAASVRKRSTPPVGAHDLSTAGKFRSRRELERARYLRKGCLLCFAHRHAADALSRRSFHSSGVKFDLSVMGTTPLTFLTLGLTPLLVHRRRLFQPPRGIVSTSGTAL